MHSSILHNLRPIQRALVAAIGLAIASCRPLPDAQESVITIQWELLELVDEQPRVCSADPIDLSCDPRGTYSAHNVIVETTDDGRVKAYISWYTDGVVVIDVTDPYYPEEVGRFHREGGDFEAENGGIQDVWGIYKDPNNPFIYASDRNGGLYVLKEFGAGSAKVGRQ